MSSVTACLIFGALAAVVCILVGWALGGWKWRRELSLVEDDLRSERDELSRLCETYLKRIDQRLTDDNGQLALVEALRGHKWSLTYDERTGDIVLANLRAEEDYRLTADGGLIVDTQTGFEYAHPYCVLCGEYGIEPVTSADGRRGSLCINCKVEVAREGLRQMGIEFPVAEEGTEDAEVSEETR